MSWKKQLKKVAKRTVKVLKSPTGKLLAGVVGVATIVAITKGIVKKQQKAKDVKGILGKVKVSQTVDVIKDALGFGQEEAPVTIYAGNITGYQKFVKGM